MEPRWRTAAFLKTVSILNVYNIPFLVFATILWTITVRPLDAVFHQKTLLLAHTILTLGAVASLGYGAIGCLFIMNATWATATSYEWVHTGATVLMVVELLSVPAMLGSLCVTMRSRTMVGPRVEPAHGHPVLVASMVDLVPPRANVATNRFGARVVQATMVEATTVVATRVETATVATRMAPVHEVPEGGGDPEAFPMERVLQATPSVLAALCMERSSSGVSRQSI